MTKTFSLIRHLKRDRDGASAVEFAIVFPVFLLVFFGILCFGAYLAVVHGVQQLTAEGARASIAGLNDSERLTLAQGNINANVASYPLISASNIAVRSAATDPATGTFTLTVQYDASEMFIFGLPGLVPAPNPIITRTSAIQRGGY